MKVLNSRLSAGIAALPTTFAHSNRFFVEENHTRYQFSHINARKVHKLCVVQASTSDASANSAPQPVEDRREGRATYRPNSYAELLSDAVEAVVCGLKDGLSRMEVEFPAVSNVDERENFDRDQSLTPTLISTAGYKGSSDLYIDANIQLALSAAKQISVDTGKRVHILLPDATEYRRAYKMFKQALELVDGVSFGHLQEGKQNAFSGFAAIFTGGINGDSPVPESANSSAVADMFIAINASTIELQDLETYAAEKIGTKPLVCWNMELDTLRADLGLLGFPPKDLQHRFLCFFKPVFYIRQRDYSKTVAVSPFIINYSGALFREYPGPWQVMLRQDNGVYACVAEDAERRYGLGEFKMELTRAMGLDTEPEGSAIAFLRSGYKTSTWWEDDEDKELNKGWRS